MGVPKLYRWITQRYPCINQILQPDTYVPFDHLYFDLNGIIHSSSHGDDTAFDVYDEKKIFETIANYINHIICLIRPQKTIFLSVDGVAPRAKMTQQRTRRFVGPKKAAAEVKKRQEKGLVVNEKALFDSNVISPGTEFMSRLHQFFKKFIARQISSEPLWSRVNVFYSGHDVPGEGEQKIREYMSYQRALPNYLPNERHCLYGMDADFIFLGLATHETNICILRENVYTVKSPLPQDIPFCLVHLSLLREYIGLEFKHLESEISFPFDLERIIDDWIFMGYLLGNDFIPHLPNMHIHAESMLYLWDTYHVVLPQLDGYLHDFGQLNLERFHVFLLELSKFDVSWFEEKEADQRWMQGKHGERMAQELSNLGKVDARVGEADSKLKPEIPASDENIVDFFQTDSHVDSPQCIDDKLAALITTVSINKSDDTATAVKAKESDEYEPEIEKEREKKFDADGGNEEVVPNEDKNLDIEYEALFDPQDPNTPGLKDVEEDEDLLAYRMHRQNYYAQKLKIDIRGTSKRSSDAFEEAALLPICRKYVQTLQWVLRYYFDNVADWTYYYPYHYAPYASDLLIFTKRFAKGGVESGVRNDDWVDFLPNTKPLLPFEQQMFIMPSASANILPLPYRWLLAPSGSPVAEFFPDDFATDLNGKLAEWEAVVLIPFIDETRMLAAMAECTKELSPEDVKRNVHRGLLILKAQEREGIKYPADFESLVSQEVDGEFFRSRVLRDAQQCQHVYCRLPRHVNPDFPSLYRIPFTHKIERMGVLTFSFPSKGESVLLTVNHPQGLGATDSKSLKSIANSYLGQVVVTGWPHCRHVVPVAVMDQNEIWEMDMPVGSSSWSLKREDIQASLGSPVSYLDAKAEWIVSRLRGRAAISFASEWPRAAFICLPIAGSDFSVVVNASDPSHICLCPLYTNVPPLAKLSIDPRLQQRRPMRANKQSLLYDANVSVPLGSGMTLEILDLTVDPSTTIANRPLLDVFPPASVALVFAPLDPTSFGRLGEVISSTADHNLIIRLHAYSPPANLAANFSETAIVADESSYLTPSQISRELHLTHHVISRIVGDFMVRVHPPPANRLAVNRKPRNSTTEDANLFNIGFSLSPQSSLSCVVGWSRYNASKNIWLFSHRTVDAIAKYLEFFPEVVNFIGANPARFSGYDIGEIFPQNTFDRYCQLRAFLLNEVKANRIVTKKDSSPLDTAGLLVVQNCLSSSPSLPSAVVHVSPICVFAVLHNGGLVMPQSYRMWLKRSKKNSRTFELLDRVIYTGPRHDIFGLDCWIIGAYPVHGCTTVEVMFNRPFNGAVSIRGSVAQCLVVEPSHLLHSPRFTESATTTVTSARKMQENREEREERCSSSTNEQQQRPITRQTVVPLKPPLPPSPPTVDALHSCLPPEWLAAAPIEFASPSTAVVASNEIATKCVTTVKADSWKRRSSDSKNLLHLVAGQESHGPHLRPDWQRRHHQQQQQQHQPSPNKQKGHKTKLTPNTVDQAKPRPPRQPESEVLPSAAPRAPDGPSPSTWHSAASAVETANAVIFENGLIETCFTQSQKYFEDSLPVSAQQLVRTKAVDPRYKPFWTVDGRIVFVDSITNQVFSVQQLYDVCFGVKHDRVQTNQLSEVFPRNQLQQQINTLLPTDQCPVPDNANTSSLLSSRKSSFVPTQVKQASFLSKHQ